MRTRNLILSTCLAPLCALGLSAPSLAQSFTGAPVYGELDYTPGAEPVSLRIRAAGAIPAERLSPDCWGYISNSPPSRLSCAAAEMSALRPPATPTRP